VNKNPGSFEDKLSVRAAALQQRSLVPVILRDLWIVNAGQLLRPAPAAAGREQALSLPLSESRAKRARSSRQ
jgi:hypothetical protein